MLRSPCSKLRTPSSHTFPADETIRYYPFYDNSWPFLRPCICAAFHRRSCPGSIFRSHTSPLVLDYPNLTGHVISSSFRSPPAGHGVVPTLLDSCRAMMGQALPLSSPRTVALATRCERGAGNGRRHGQIIRCWQLQRAGEDDDVCCGEIGRQSRDAREMSWCARLISAKAARCG